MLVQLSFDLRRMPGRQGVDELLDGLYVLLVAVVGGLSSAAASRMT